MPGSSRTSMTTMVTVLVGIAGLIFILARAGAPIAGAEPAARGAVVEFTPDGKLKQPVGYRQWIYVGASVTPNDLNGGKALFPEFHAIYIDPESFAEYGKTGKFRDGTVLVKELSSVGSKESDQRQRLLPRRLHGVGGLDKGLEALQGRARQLGLLQLRPQVPARSGGVQKPHLRVQQVPPGQCQAGLGFHPELQRLACGGPTFEVKHTRGHRRPARLRGRIIPHTIGDAHHAH